MAAITVTCLHIPSTLKLKNKNTKTNKITKTKPLLYPKSTPTPLLLSSQTALFLTRHQAINLILDDLQSSLVRGAPIDPTILSSLLETCSSLRSPAIAIRLRSLIPPTLLRRRAALSSKLVRLHSACGLIKDAHHLFDQMPRRYKTTAFPWNSLLSGYTDLSLFDDAMAVYYQMEEEGVQPDHYTFPRVLKACAGLGSVSHGEAVHRHAVRSSLSANIFVQNALIDMYSKCGDIVRARRVFGTITNPDIVSWNCMLAGYLRHGLLFESLETCREMIRAGVEPDSVTVSSMLAGFSSQLGSQIHCWVLRRGMESNLSIANALIGMYSNCNQLGSAIRIFEAMPEKDVVSWNAIISAHRDDDRVLDVFQRMEDSGLQPDKITFVALLSACAKLGLVEEGRRLFRVMEEKYKLMPRQEHYGCMVNLLGRAGLVGEAYELVSERMVFEGGATVWGALLFACSVHGNAGIGEIAAERLFELEPDNGHNFELMMKIYRNAGREEDAEVVRRLMRGRGLDSTSCEDQMCGLDCDLSG